MISNSVLSAFIAALSPIGEAKLPAARRGLGAAAFESLPDPTFLIDSHGRLSTANRAGRALLGALLPEGSKGSLGKRELADLFTRAAQSSLCPAPLRLETREGERYYELRAFPLGAIPRGISGRRGCTALSLADISVWKRAIAEKERELFALRSAAEKPVVVCARCGALKGSDGKWGEPGALSGLGIAPERLSHGLCPGCLSISVTKLR